MMNIRDPRIELMSREELRELQLRRLIRQIKYVYALSPFYSRKFDKAGIKPSDIKSQQDMVKLPVTTAREIYEEMERSDDAFAGRLCVLEDELAYKLRPAEFPALDRQFPECYVFQGKILAEIDRMNKLIARHWFMMGVNRGDVILSKEAPCWENTNFSIDSQVSWPLRGVGGELDLTMLHMEAMSEGTMLILELGIDSKERFQYIFNFKAYSPIHCIFLHTADVPLFIQRMKELGVTTKDLGTEVLAIRYADYTGVESHEKRKEIADEFGIEPYCILDIPDVAFYSSECPERSGIHVSEDMFLVEATAPETGERVKAGEFGKLTITNLWAEATPMLRYQTELDVKLEEETCPCGRTHARIIPQGYK
jgi:phenylacetate-CoA ligase